MLEIRYTLDTIAAAYNKAFRVWNMNGMRQGEINGNNDK